MAAITINLIFDAAVRIHLREEKTITISISADGIRVKFPTTRRLAEFLKVPHYYVLPYFAMMEEENLVTRAERVGIMTTVQGTERYLRILDEKYHDEAESLLGKEMLRILTNTAGPR